MYLRVFRPLTTYSSTSGPVYQRSTPTSPTHKTGTSTYQSAATSSSSKSGPMKALHLPKVFKRNEKIKFYNWNDPYYEFTNFYRTPIKIDGKVWPTTEHYFQAQKFVGTPYVELIRKLSSAREAFQKSREPSVSKWQRSDWGVVKDDIMLKALWEKFTQNEILRDKLLGTKKMELIEHTSNDSYWGDGGDGSGQNKLGKLLMRVREELRKKHGDPRKSSANLSRPLRRTNSLSHLPTSSQSFDSSTSRSRLSAEELGQSKRSSKASDLSKQNKHSVSKQPLYSYAALRNVKALASPSVFRRQTIQAPSIPPNPPGHLLPRTLAPSQNRTNASSVNYDILNGWTTKH